jgi:hypothetical protein
MPSPQFNELKLELLRGGVAPFYVRRAILELSEHYTDLESDALAAGMASGEAARYAQALLGREESLAAAILAHAELLDWSRRWPRVALWLRSATMIASLPGVPVMFCVDNGSGIARWGASLALATLVVGSLLFSLNWLIVSG